MLHDLFCCFLYDFRARVAVFFFCFSRGLPFGKKKTDFHGSHSLSRLLGVALGEGRFERTRGPTKTSKSQSGPVKKR